MPPHENPRVGGGGREHALCWSLHRSPLVEEIYCAPGNPGIAEVADCIPIEAGDIVEIADLAGKLHVDLTVIGPELPLSLGIVDEFVKRGLPIFGPTRLAGADRVLEGLREGVFQAPQHPDRRVGDLFLREQARKAIKEYGFPVVLKADGLAGGQGVLDRRVPTRTPSAPCRLFFQERGLRRRRRPDRRGGVPPRAGVLVPRAVRRRGLRAAADGARLQEGLRRRPRDPTPAGWARTLRPAC
jgi:hypothetical protein